MKDELRLLLSLVSGESLPEGQIENADWDLIVAAAERHQLGSILYARLKELGLVLPAGTAQRLKNTYLLITKHNMRLFHEVEKIMRLMDQYGIETIAHKGIWLARELYDHIGLRPMADADLLIKKEDLERAKEIMGSLGYSSVAKETRPQTLQDEFGGEVCFTKAGGPVIELHWKLFRGEWIRYTARIDEERIRQRAFPFLSGGARRPSSEDGLIHVCVHLAVNHQMSRSALRTLYEIYLMQKKWPIDWPKVVRLAAEWKVATAVWLVLHSLKDIFTLDCERFPLEELAPSPLKKAMLDAMVPTSFIVEGKSFNNSFRRLLYLFAVTDSLSSAMVLFFRAFFPERDWLKLRYGIESASPFRVTLQQLIHPFLLLARKKV